MVKTINLCGPKIIASQKKSVQCCAPKIVILFISGFLLCEYNLCHIEEHVHLMSFICTKNNYDHQRNKNVFLNILMRKSEQPCTKTRSSEQLAQDFLSVLTEKSYWARSLQGRVGWGLLLFSGCKSTGAGANTDEALLGAEKVCVRSTTTATATAVRFRSDARRACLLSTRPACFLPHYLSLSETWQRLLSCATC